MEHYQWAERELSLLLASVPEGQAVLAQQKMNEHLLRVVREFDSEGHSAMSANYAAVVLHRLLHYQPLTSLTGEEDEWIEVGEESEQVVIQQNNRCPHVFRELDKEGNVLRAYDNTAKVFSYDGGQTWGVSIDSRVEIEFPYWVPVQPERITLRDEKL